MDLLKNKERGGPLGPFDGVVGAIVKIGAESYYITTHSDYIPTPPTSKDVYLRSNMRFGIDDPTLWPQYFSPTFPHLAAIPRREERPDLELMWWKPSRKDFTEGTAITRSLGKLVPWMVSKFIDKVDEIKLRYQECVKTLVNPPAILGEVAANLVFALERLQSLPTTFDKLRFCIASLQLNFLELESIIAFMTIYQPRLKTLTSDPSPSIAPCVGAFTFRPDVAQQLHTAGLPFWLLRPFHTFADEKILKTVSVVEPPYALIEPCAAGQQPVYSGTSVDAKIRAMGSIARQMAWYRDPFAETPSDAAGQAREVATSAVTSADSSQSTSVSGPERTASRSRPTPYTRPSNPNKQQPTDGAGQNGGGRNKFSPLEAEDMPSYLTPWTAALELVNPAGFSRAAPEDKYYVFPEPALLASSQSLSRRNKFLHHWLLLKDAFTFIASEGPLCLSSQEWRNVLEGTVERDETRRNKRTKNSRPLQQIIAPVLSALQIEGLQNFPAPLEAIPQYTTTVAKQVIWQIAEVNFRCELLSLDRRASGLRRQDFVQIKKGLASDSLVERHRYHRRLARLMRDWKNVRAARPQWIDRFAACERDGIGLTDPQMVELEWAVTRYYTLSFFELYVLPMRLDHDFVEMPIV
ncbi:hypothetical protein R3P38DRAFT_3335456 [Favolaschia claudopus]|uniref:Uncharacterized protein n=1 Tax=Favolaschia claudopus TaxID=2862362 RepID=A0AAV9Z991_9AGAR